MKRFAVFCLIFIFCESIYAQESGLVVRYDFTDKSSPPMIPFYLRVYINDILIDSTKPHKPNHNLANAVQIQLNKGNYNLKIEGVTKPDDQNSISVMEWISKLEITKGKSRVHLKLNERFQVRSSTINY